MDIAIMIICVILSAFFSATETAFSSASRIKMLNLAENGSKRAESVIRIIDKYDKFLTTVLVGNNIVNILLATVAAVFFVNRIGSEYGATVSTAAVTVVVLIFGEITPKSLAKEIPEKFCMAVVPIVRCLIFVFTPINFVFSLWTRFITKIAANEKEPAITDDELITIVNEAYNEGEIDEAESELIRNAIVFDDRQAEDILTPRVDITAISADCEASDAVKVFSEAGYSRIPVYEGSLDNIVGIIHQKDFFENVLYGDKMIKDILKKPLFVAPTMKIGNLLRKLQREQTHIAVVVDEYGGTAGLVTMEDILEELVGEIWDEHDEVVEDISEVSDGTYLVQGTLLLEELFESFGIEDADSEADTLSGWVMEKLGRIPEKNDSFEFCGYVFTISEIVSRRITEVKIERIKKAEE